MAVTGQIKILENEVEKLSLLSEYIRNPAIIEKLKTDVINLNALSEDETKKSQDARALIAEHKTLLDSLKIENEKHENNKAEISAREALLLKMKEDLTDAVSRHTVEHQANIDALAEEKKAFAAQIEKENIRITNADEGFKKQIENFKSEKNAIVIEKERVAGIEKEALALKSKYEKKLALIQSDI